MERHAGEVMMASSDFGGRFNKHYIEMGRTIRVQKRERTVCKYESSQRVTT